jgi:hypothetical protein
MIHASQQAGTRLALAVILVAGGLGGTASARADDARADSADEAPETLPPTLDEIDARLQAAENRIEQTNGIIIARQPRLTLGGYADFGFFAPQGNGAGIIRDTGGRVRPDLQGRYGWVFLGDILAPTVNSRGEAADLGDAAGAKRADGIHSGGAPGFILNEVNLSLGLAVAENVIGTTSFNVVPRSGSDFALGDTVDVDLAQVEWLPTASRRTSIFVGKIDPVIGIEYRDRKANQRFGVTPSLLARYTTGTALGLKARSKFGRDDLFVVAGAITNGSTTTEQFHFYDEIDRNAGKTLSGRLSLRPPLGTFVELEVGASGAYGAQDRASNSLEPMWFLGLDLLGRVGRVDVKAQWLTGKAAGWPGESVYGLDLKSGAYVELNALLGSRFGVLVRGEMRDAFVWLGDPDAPEGANRAYVTKSWRATVGARVVFNQHMVLKVEALHNGEYGGIPGIRNDVLTSSLVFSN